MGRRLMTNSKTGLDSFSREERQEDFSRFVVTKMERPGVARFSPEREF